MFERVLREDRHSKPGVSLSVLELYSIPFVPKRLYWICDILPSEPRGFHAHKRLNQLIIIIEGSIRLKLYRGSREFIFDLGESDDHILIPFGTWREIDSLSEKSTILVIADREYDEDDYIREWETYLKWYATNINEC